MLDRLAAIIRDNARDFWAGDTRIVARSIVMRVMDLRTGRMDRVQYCAARSRIYRWHNGRARNVTDQMRA